MIPYSRPTLSDLYVPYPRVNNTLHSGTYLYSPYMAVLPPECGVKTTEMINVKGIISVELSVQH